MRRTDVLRQAALALLVSTSIPGCDKEKPTAATPDRIRPGAVTNLSVVTVTDSSVTLAWTAVGDDSLTGRASRYDLRRSPVEITPANWGDATAVTGLGVPKPVGEQESFEVRGLTAWTQYNFALAVGDEQPNWSAISRNTSARTQVRYLPPTSGANLLNNLRQAYMLKDLDEFLRLLADDFVFEVSPAAFERDPTIPPTWELSEEKTIHQHMFTAETVERITLDFIQHPGVPDSMAYPGLHLWKVRMDGIHLVINTRQGGQLFTYLVPNSMALFYLKEDPTRLVGGKPTWSIVRWKDEPIGMLAGGAVIETTWGEIKHLFR